MKKRSDVVGDNSPRDVVVKSDSVNEEVIFAAAMLHGEFRKKLADKIEPDRFLTTQCSQGWPAIREMVRLGLEWSPETFAKLLGERDVDYYIGLAKAYPDLPKNLDFHVDLLLWDKARHTAVTGPISSLLDAIRDPRETPERVKALARQVPEALEGYKERSFLLDGEQMVNRQMDDIHERRQGRGTYPLGIDGLDYFERIADQPRRPRLIPGAAPGKLAVIGGVPGSGKSTLCANIANGLRKQGRRGFVGALEMGGGTTCELCAAIEEDISLEALRIGSITDEEEQRIEARMREIAKMVVFLDKDAFFRKKGDRSGNDARLDMLQGYISDSGAEWVIIDLWRRILKKIDPDEEELALIRQQAMAEETKTTQFLVQQIRLKDLEQRVNKTPTRESFKGSGAWIECPDLVLATDRDGLWKDVRDDKMTVCILKQRFGKWPLAVEMPFDPDKGKLDEGKSVRYAPYDGESSTGDAGGVSNFRRPAGGRIEKWQRGRRI